MSDKALYSTTNTEVIPAGTADGLLKRNAANTAWEFKTAAQLGIAASMLQTAFAEQAADTNTGSGAFVDLGVVTVTLTIQAGSILLINFTASASNTSTATTIDFQLMIDGVAVRGTGMRTAAINVPSGNSIVYRKTGLAAGAHTVKIQWRTGGGSARIRPTTTVNEHASLLVQEVTV